MGLRRTLGLSAFPARSLGRDLLNSETTLGLNLKVPELKIIAGYQRYPGVLLLHIHSYCTPADALQSLLDCCNDII